MKQIKQRAGEAMKQGSERMEGAVKRLKQWWQVLSALMLLGLAAGELGGTTDEEIWALGGFTNTEIDSIKDEQDFRKKTAPSSRGEVVVPPANYTTVPVRLTLVGRNPKSSYQCGPYDLSLDRFEPQVVQMEVGKMYKFFHFFAITHLNFEVEEGYQVLVSMKKSNTAFLYKFGGGWEDDFALYNYVMVVPSDEGSVGFGEAMEAKLEETFSWKMSLGKSAISPFEILDGEFTYLPYAYNPGIKGKDTIDLGFIRFNLGLKAHSASSLTDLFKTSSILNFPHAAPVVAPASGIKFELDPNDDQILRHVNTLLDRTITITDHENISSQADGFDIEITNNNDDSIYRKYEFRVDDANDKLTISSYRGQSGGLPNLLRVEQLSYASGEWILEKKATATSDVLKESRVRVVIDPVSTDDEFTEYEIKDRGRVDGTLQLSSRLKKRFKTYEWTVNTSHSHEQERLIKLTTYDADSGGNSWETDYDYYDDYANSPASFLQLKSVAENTDGSGESSHWEAYTYHESYNISSTDAYGPFGFPSNYEDGKTSSKAGRLHKKYEPFENTPSSVSWNDTSGKVTEYYYKFEGDNYQQFTDAISAKVIRINGEFVEAVAGIVSNVLNSSYSDYIFFSGSEEVMGILSANDTDYGFQLTDTSIGSLFTSAQLLTYDTDYDAGSHLTVAPYVYPYTYTNAIPALRSYTEVAYDELLLEGRKKLPDGTAKDYFEMLYVYPGESTATYRAYDIYGNQIGSEKHVWTGTSGVKPSTSPSSWDRIEWEDRTYSDYRLTSVTNSKGLTETRSYYPSTSPYYGKLQTVTDMSGVVTTYSYDIFDRVVSKTVSSGGTTVPINGVNHVVPERVETMTYDGSNRVVKTEVNGELTGVKRYDLAGHLIAELNGDGDGTYYDYSNLEDNITSEVTVWGVSSWADLWKSDPGLNILSVLATPDGTLSSILSSDVLSLNLSTYAASSITHTETYKDGSLYQRWGTAVTKEIRSTESIALASDGTCLIETVTMGATNPIVMKTGRDMVGRVTFKESPSYHPSTTTNKIITRYFYERDGTGTNPWDFQDGCGQVSKITREVVNSSGGVVASLSDILYTYDALGRVETTTLKLEDGSGNPYVQTEGSFSDSGRDRVTKNGYGYYEDGNGDWWWEETTSALFSDANATDDEWIVISRTRERVSGFTTTGGYTVTAESKTWGIENASTPSDQSATLTKTEVNPTAKLERTTVIQPGVTGERRTVESYSSHGLNLVTREPGGGSTTNKYDDQWRLDEVYGPRGVLQSKNVYLTLGGAKLSKVKTPDSDANNTNAETQFTYESGSAGGRLKSQRDAAGNYTYFEYDARNQVTKTWGPKVYPVSYEYDEFGRKTKMHAYRDDSSFQSASWPGSPGTGDVTTWSYDGETGLLEYKQAPKRAGESEGQKTEYLYDGFNRQTRRLLANGKLKETTYNSKTGEVFAQKYYKNVTVIDQSTLTADSTDTPSVYFSYDRVGNVYQVKDGTGTRTFTYEDTGETGHQGLLHSESMAFGSSTYLIEYDYDGGKRRLSSINHGLVTAGNSMDFGYSDSGATGLLETITASTLSSGSETFTYNYLADTSWIERLDAGSNYKHYRSYETYRNMVKGTESKWSTNSIGKVSHTRDKLGRITSLDREFGHYAIYDGWGLRQSFSYTSKGELESTSTATLNTPGTPLLGRSLDLTYDGQGNRETLEVDGEVSHAYTPGPANEYTGISYGEHAAQVAGISEDPGVVAVGEGRAERQGKYFYYSFAAETTANWTLADILAGEQVAPDNYVEDYTKAQKAVYVPPASVTPTYDESGNLLFDGKWNYTYDGENRLIKMLSARPHYSNGYWRELLFTYDYLGRRVSKEESELFYAYHGSDGNTLSKTGYAYWEWHLLAEVDISSGSYSMKRHYAWGLDKEGVRPGAGGVGGLLMLVDHGQSKTYYAMNDYMGNVIGLCDASDGSVDAEYEYDPFGREIRATGTYADKNPFRFSSQYTDTETDLVYFGFRYYTPDWGRFLNRDPLQEEGGENLYRFVSNDPVNRWDLLGLSDGTDQEQDQDQQEQESNENTDTSGSQDAGKPEGTLSNNIGGDDSKGGKGSPKSDPIAENKNPQESEFDSNRGRRGNVSSPNGVLTLGEFGKASLQGAKEGLTSPHGKMLSGILALLLSGGSASPYIAALGGSSGTLTAMNGLGEKIAEFSKDPDAGGGFKNVPSSIPQMGGALGGELIGNDPGKGIQAVSILEQGYGLYQGANSMESTQDLITFGIDAFGFGSDVIDTSEEN